MSQLRFEKGLSKDNVQFKQANLAVDMAGPAALCGCELLSPPGMKRNHATGSKEEGKGEKATQTLNRSQGQKALLLNPGAPSIWEKWLFSDSVESGHREGVLFSVSPETNIEARI